jgi:hypothetical protein
MVGVPRRFVGQQKLKFSKNQKIDTHNREKKGTDEY